MTCLIENLAVVEVGFGESLSPAPGSHLLPIGLISIGRLGIFSTPTHDGLLLVGDVAHTRQHCVASLLVVVSAVTGYVLVAVQAVEAQAAQSICLVL